MRLHWGKLAYIINANVVNCQGYSSVIPLWAAFCLCVGGVSLFVFSFLLTSMLWLTMWHIGRVDAASILSAVANKYVAGGVEMNLGEATTLCDITKGSFGTCAFNCTCLIDARLTCRAFGTGPSRPLQALSPGGSGYKVRKWMDTGPLTLYANINDLFRFVMLLLGVLSPDD